MANSLVTAPLPARKTVPDTLPLPFNCRAHSACRPTGRRTAGHRRSHYSAVAGAFQSALLDEGWLSLLKKGGEGIGSERHRELDRMTKRFGLESVFRGGLGCGDEVGRHLPRRWGGTRILVG